MSESRKNQTPSLPRTSTSTTVVSGGSVINHPVAGLPRPLTDISKVEHAADRHDHTIHDDGVSVLKYAKSDFPSPRIRAGTEMTAGTKFNAAAPYDHRTCNQHAHSQSMSSSNASAYRAGSVASGVMSHGESLPYYDQTAPAADSDEHVHTYGRGGAANVAGPGKKKSKRRDAGNLYGPGIEGGKGAPLATAITTEGMNKEIVHPINDLGNNGPGGTGNGRTKKKASWWRRGLCGDGEEEDF